jgi:hypothetical protein
MQYLKAGGGHSSLLVEGHGAPNSVLQRDRGAPAQLVLGPAAVQVDVVHLPGALGTVDGCQVGPHSRPDQVEDPLPRMPSRPGGWNAIGRPYAFLGQGSVIVSISAL